MQLENARQIADYLVQLLAPHCEPDRIHIAGSIRRGVAFPGDIEIVCLPAQRQALADALLLRPTVSRIKGGFARENRYCQMMIKSRFGDIKLDLFMPRRGDYFRQLAIRTGSADFSYRIAQHWLKAGFCGTDEGLFRQSDCTRKGKDWKPNAGTLPMRCDESEEAFFELIGLGWIPPERR